MDNKRVLALFDFDGTLTYSDSVHFFYKNLYTSKFRFILKHYIMVIPYLMAYKCKLIDLKTIKEVRLNSHLSRMNDGEIVKAIYKFRELYFASQIKLAGIDKLNWHKNLGHTIAIVSASWFPLLSGWAEENKLILITNTTTRHSTKFTFDLPDCNYDVKVLRVKAIFDLNEYNEIYVYGDTPGDDEMLKLGDYKFYQHFN